MGFAHMHKHDRKSPLPHTEMRFPPDVNETTMQQRADDLYKVCTTLTTLLRSYGCEVLGKPCVVEYHLSILSQHGVRWVCGVKQ